MKRLILMAISLIVTIASMAQHPALIPNPDKVEWGSGALTVTPKLKITVASKNLLPAAEYLQSTIESFAGITVKTGKGKGGIRLELGGKGVSGGYSLQVDADGATVTGNDYKGVINGIATLRQLLSRQGEAWVMPAVTVKDAPRFEWRGMELDCSRHFFTVSEVKELLNVLAYYKIDKFHWHLTDDQGWRIEIKRYPLLTQKGAWRKWNNQDTICFRTAATTDNPEMIPDHAKTRITAEGDTLYGGFYTQDEIRDIVKYAAQRGIDVIPEIDQPGHSEAATSNYEGLSCTGDMTWGQFFSAPMCPGKDKMIEFCKNVWSEVFELFPYEYVHIGGDEVDMKNWKKCPDCKKRMEENGLKTFPELQTWFNHQMEAFFTAHGKKMIGWDEVIAGGLSPTTTVMWWRSWVPTAPKQTTSKGNNIIFTPNNYFYVDNAEDKNSVSNIYGFDMEPKDLTVEEQGRILGCQGNLWTEWVPTRNRMFYRAFPRIIAIAELAWSKPERKDFGDFAKRLAAQYPRLQMMNVTYRIPDLTGFNSTNVFTDEATVAPQCSDPTAVIRYTTDGTLPTAQSKRYDGPFTISESADFIFRTFGPGDRKGDFVKTSFRKETLAEAVKPEQTTEGLKALWYDYTGPSCEGIDKAKLNGEYVANGVVIPDDVKGNIGLILSGYISVPEDGIYTFALLSDDGSWLKIDDRMVVDNDGEHSPKEIVGQHAMRAGLHPLTARYFDHNGGQLRLKVTDKNGKEVEVKYCH